jgi:hypothetical protein
VQERSCRETSGGPNAGYATALAQSNQLKGNSMNKSIFAVSFALVLAACDNPAPVVVQPSAPSPPPTVVVAPPADPAASAEARAAADKAADAAMAANQAANSANRSANRSDYNADKAKDAAERAADAAKK